MSNSRMVYATKYKLLIPESKKDGIYRNTGQDSEREKLYSKLVTREYVEERNAGRNAETWVIDEAKTTELLKQRELNIAKQAKQKQSDSATQGDLVDAIRALVPNSGTSTETLEMKETQLNQSNELAELKAKLEASEKENAALKESKQSKIPADDTQPEPISYPTDIPSEAWTVAQLQAFCNDNGIKYHHLTKEAGLLKLINEDLTKV